MTVPVPLTADPTRWLHALNCYDTTIPCWCGLSALREAVAAGDPLAVLDLLGMGGTLTEGEVMDHDGLVWRLEAVSEYERRAHHDDRPLYRVVRPLPDTPEVSP